METYKKLCSWLLPKKALHYRSIESNSALVLINIILFNIGLTIIATLGIIFYLDSLSDDNLKLSLLTLAFIFAGFIAALLLFKTLGSYTLSGNLVSLSCYLPLTFAVLLTGGYNHSPLVPIYAIIPIFSFLIIGLRAGIIWGLMVVTTQILINISSKWDIPTQQLLNLADIEKFKALVDPFTTLIFCTSLIIYESKNRLLKSHLFDERNKFAHQSTHDDLTEIPNRKEFNYQIKRKISEAAISNNKFCIVYIDLDGFKPINDQYGHHAGDYVLKIIAERLLLLVRSSDTVARLGGDEFAIILDEAKSKEAITRVSRNIISEVEKPMAFENIELHVSASVGLAIYPEDGETIEAICVHADAAMYKAKVTKNTFCFYEKA